MSRCSGPCSLQQVRQFIWSKSFANKKRAKILAFKTSENHLQNALCIFEKNKQPNAMHIAGQLVTTEGNAHICSAHRNRFTHLPNHATGTAVYVVYERYFWEAQPCNCFSSIWVVQKSPAQPCQRLRCPQCICEARWACPGEMPWDKKKTGEVLFECLGIEKRFGGGELWG